LRTTRTTFGATAAQNRLGIHPPLEAKVSRFHDRPFLVIHAERFSDAIRATIQDEAVRALPPHLGGPLPFTPHRPSGP
jgi:hypothetical protein